jgi:predicted RNase H-like HicB family nuclease
MKYLVIVEECPGGFGAYVPDLPGCVAAGRTRKEVLEIPPPTSRGTDVELRS